MTRAAVRSVLAAIVLTVAAGCTPAARIKPETRPVPETGPTVTRLEEGRQGFIIKEPAALDESSTKAFEQAVALMNDKDFAGAIELLEKVVERSPGVTAPYINLGMAYRQVGKPDAAEAHLKTALSLIPHHPAASNEYGLLCRKAGRFQEAREIYEQALTRFPDFYPMRRNFGILCDLYLDDPLCALEQYEAYSAGMPEDRQVKLWIADLRNRLGK